MLGPVLELYRYRLAAQSALVHIKGEQLDALRRWSCLDPRCRRRFRPRSRLTGLLRLPAVALADSLGCGHDGDGDQSGPLVLVVDDDRTVADVVSVYLANAGYSVVSAADGARALELAER